MKLPPVARNLLQEAYESYQRTGDCIFVVIPKNKEYLTNVLASIEPLQEVGFIDSVTDNLVYPRAVHISPTEHMSFRITAEGVNYIRFGRDC